MRDSFLKSQYILDWTVDFIPRDTEKQENRCQNYINTHIDSFSVRRAAIERCPQYQRTGYAGWFSEKGLIANCMSHCSGGVFK